MAEGPRTVRRNQCAPIETSRRAGAHSLNLLSLCVHLRPSRQRWRGASNFLGDFSPRDVYSPGGSILKPSILFIGSWPIGSSIVEVDARSPTPVANSSGSTSGSWFQGIFPARNSNSTLRMNILKFCTEKDDFEKRCGRHPARGFVRKSS